MAGESVKNYLRTALLNMVNDFSGDALDVDTNLVEGGVDSLSVTVILNRIESEFGVTIPLPAFTAMDNISEIVEHIHARAPNFQIPSQNSRKVPVDPAPSSPSLLINAAQNESHQESSAGVPELDVGVRVKIIGLQTHSELNGIIGTIISFYEPKNRWQIRFDGESKDKLFRSKNLEYVGSVQSAEEQKRFNAKRAMSCITAMLQENHVHLATDSIPGLRAVHTCNGPHVYIVHGEDTEILGVRANYTTIASLLPECNVACLVYDDVAYKCDSVLALAELYIQRIHADIRQKSGHTVGKVTLIGFLFGCIIAHEMAPLLQESGMQTKLVLFDIDESRPLTYTVDRDNNCEYGWLGGDIEASLLAARCFNADKWAEQKARAFRKHDPGENTSDLYKLTWEQSTGHDMSFSDFRNSLTKIGRNSERIHELIQHHVPAKTFDGHINIVHAPKSQIFKRHF